MIMLYLRTKCHALSAVSCTMYLSYSVLVLLTDLISPSKCSRHIQARTLFLPHGIVTLITSPVNHISLHSHCKPSRTDSAWKTNLLYEMEAFTLHTEPDRACSRAEVCFYSLADDRFCCAIVPAVGVRVFFSPQ